MQYLIKKDYASRATYHLDIRWITIYGLLFYHMYKTIRNTLRKSDIPIRNSKRRHMPCLDIVPIESFIPNERAGGSYRHPNDGKAAAHTNKPFETIGIWIITGHSLYYLWHQRIHDRYSPINHINESYLLRALPRTKRYESTSDCGSFSLLHFLRIYCVTCCITFLPRRNLYY